MELYCGDADQHELRTGVHHQYHRDTACSPTHHTESLAVSDQASLVVAQGPSIVPDML